MAMAVVLLNVSVHLQDTRPPKLQGGSDSAALPSAAPPAACSASSPTPAFPLQKRRETKLQLSDLDPGLPGHGSQKAARLLRAVPLGPR